MFTLVLFVLIAAGVVLSAYAAAQQPQRLDLALPVGALGLTWRLAGERQTRNGLKTLWVAERGDHAAFTRLYDRGRDDMRALGFGWGGETYGSYDRPVCWEPVPAPVEIEFVAGFQRADAAARAAEEREAAADEARVRAYEKAKAVAWAREGKARLVDLQALRDRLRDLPWAWTRRQRDRATEVLCDPERPSAWAAKEARRLVATVDEMLRRVTERAQTERVERYWIVAADPTVQVDVHTATQILSSRDADFASIDNGEGWSKAHCHMGHVLSGMPAFGQVEAAHALRVVHPHRGQLPAELRQRLFREA